MPATGPATTATLVERLAAFTDTPSGGNPAGVVLDAASVATDSRAMLAIAADVGYSETVFVTDGPVTTGRRSYAVRYFSPEAEVPFCGHATVALGVAIGHRLGPGPVELSTGAGPVRVEVAGTDGVWRATLVSPPPSHEALPRDQLEALLACFGWTADVLDPGTPPAVGYAGARHAIIPLADRATLTAMAYDYRSLRDLSRTHGWVTVHLAWAETPTRHHVRAPFPFGGVVEDPATGAGAAAYVGYLRDIGLLDAPGELIIRQGVDMGRPSTLYAAFDPTGPVRVGGQAVPIDA